MKIHLPMNRKRENTVRERSIYSSNLSCSFMGVDIIERLGESYYLVRECRDNTIAGDMVTLACLPPHLDIQVGERVMIEGSCIRERDISFVRSTDTPHLNRANDPVSRLYGHEIKELSRNLRDVDFTIQVSENEADMTRNPDDLVRYARGYSEQTLLDKTTVMKLAPPGDVSPAMFLYAESSQYHFFVPDIPATEHRVRWNAALMLAKAIIPAKNPRRSQCDRLATWLIMRDGRHESTTNESLIRFIEGCRSFETIIGNQQDITLVMEDIRLRFRAGELNGHEGELVGILGLDERTMRPTALINKCHRIITGIANNFISPNKGRELLVRAAADMFQSSDVVSARIAVHLHDFMSRAQTVENPDSNKEGEEETLSGSRERNPNFTEALNSYKTGYKLLMKDYIRFCKVTGIPAYSPMDGFLQSPDFLAVTRKIHKPLRKVRQKPQPEKEASDITASLWKNTLLKNFARERFLLKENHLQQYATLCSTKKSRMTPIQIQESLDRLSNRSLVENIISHARIIYGMIHDYVKKALFSHQSRIDIKSMMLGLAAMIAETHFGKDSETRRSRDYFFHYRKQGFREDFVALLRGIGFLDRIMSNTALIEFYDQLCHVLKSIMIPESYSLHVMMDKDRGTSVTMETPTMFETILKQKTISRPKTPALATTSLSDRIPGTSGDMNGLEDIMNINLSKSSSHA